MAQWAKVLAVHSWQPEFASRNPPKVGKKRIQSCPLTGTRTLTHMLTPSHIMYAHKNNNLKIWNGYIGLGEKLIFNLCKIPTVQKW